MDFSRTITRAATALGIATGSVMGFSAPSGASVPNASAARSCPAYTVVTHRTFGGQHYRYVVRVHEISAIGIDCVPSRILTRRADNTLAPEPGVYQAVPPWQCRAFRPFAGGPGGESMWFSDCKRRNGWRLSWTETQLSATRTS